MHNRSPALSEQIAGLRNTAQARKETRVWLPAAIDALIAAIFARIFGRLEQLLLLWQTGQLPAPQSVLMTAAPRACAQKKPSVHQARQRTHRQRPAPPASGHRARLARAEAALCMRRGDEEHARRGCRRLAARCYRAQIHGVGGEVVHKQQDYEVCACRALYAAAAHLCPQRHTACPQRR